MSQEADVKNDVNQCDVMMIEFDGGLDTRSGATNCWS